MYFLLSFHPIISFTILSIVSVSIVTFFLLITRKMLHMERLKENHDLANAILNVFGVIYAVVIAFVVYASWNEYDIAKKNIEIEANKIAALFLDAEAFDDPMKKNIRTAVINYTKAIIEEEWPLMANPIGPRGTTNSRDAHKDIWDALVNVDIKTLKNPYMYEESIRQLNSMTEYRRLRRFSSKSSTPDAIWVVMIAGGIISAAYTLLFGTRHVKIHCIMVAAYTTITTMVLYLIYIFDHPFTGYSSISNAPFKSILKMFLKTLGQ
jgi:hypothetical protein